jgi:hypothetical protein
MRTDLQPTTNAVANCISDGRPHNCATHGVTNRHADGKSDDAADGESHGGGACGVPPRLHA